MSHVIAAENKFFVKLVCMKVVHLHLHTNEFEGILKE